MSVRIYQPAKSVMQSGRAGTAEWIIEHERAVPRIPEPLMGWTSADDTLNEIRLVFKTVDEAVAFAQKKGWAYNIGHAHQRHVKPRNYVDNFRYLPPADGE
jgi:hypothetical protein